MTVITDTKITDPNLIADSLNRLVKLALDTGEAASIEEAIQLFAGYRLAVAVGRALSEETCLSCRGCWS